MDELDVICLLFVDGITLRVLPFVENSWEFVVIHVYVYVLGTRIIQELFINYS